MLTLRSAAWRCARNHFSIILVTFYYSFAFLSHKTHKKSIKTNIFHIFFTQKGTLTLTPGMGMGWWWGGGDYLGPPNPPKSQKYISYENCSHFCDFVFSKMSNSIFKISSYIQKKTQNPINAFKITIYNTKHTNNTKTHLNKSQTLEHIKKHFLFD